MNTKEDSCCMAAREMTLEEVLRQKAREFHEQGVAFDKAADEVKVFNNPTLLHLVLKGLYQ